MSHFPLANTLSRFFDIRFGEFRRVRMMVALLFFLLAANNVIKVVRDSLFLGHFLVSDLSYVYLLVALLSGGIIAIYTRYTARLPFYQLMLGSHAFIISNVIVFWYLIVFCNFAWAIYAFYIWSAIVGILAVAQFWTLADLIFTSREAKRLFGIFSAGGSLGAILGGFASGSIVNVFGKTDELFWFIGALFASAFGVVWLARKELCELESAAEREIPATAEMKADQQTGALAAIRGSHYLQLIASTIFVSVIVSTLIDFQFKAAAQTAYASQESLPLPANIKKQVKTFLDVILQRFGDGAAGLIVLVYALCMVRVDPAGLAYFSLGLILLWTTFIFLLRSRYIDALRMGLEAQAISWENGDIDYADKQTIETVLQTLQRKDEQALLFGLKLAEKLDPKVVMPHVPIGLLGHPSPLVRSRSLKLFAATTEPEKLKEIVRLLQDENGAVRAEAINVVCAIRKEDAISVMRPYLESPDPRVQRSAIECLLHHGDGEIREVALASFRKMIAMPGVDGAAARIEAARLIGEVADPQLRGSLPMFIREDSSMEVVREALAAAGKIKELAVVRDVIMRLGCPKTKTTAHQALVEYGESAVEPLREVLLDPNISRDVRVNIPSALSKIDSPAALNALLNGLNQEDGSLRYRIIVGLEEMARRLPNLRMDRHAIELTIDAEASHYYRRFLTFFALFGDETERSMSNDSLLHQALLENMERERERVLRLLSLIYCAGDIGSATVALRSRSHAKQAQAIEFLDNLLSGEIKRRVFPLFDDALGVERYRQFLALLGLKSFDGETALQELLKQDDVWLRAAALWEIGLRKLQAFREEIQKYLNSEDPLLKETAELVISRM